MYTGSDKGNISCTSKVTALCEGGEVPDTPDTPDTPDIPNDDQPTDVVNNHKSQFCTKLLRNGQIIIFRNGKEYDIMGNVK